MTASLSKLETFQCSSTLPNIKYNYEVLFMGQLYWLLPPATKFGQGYVFTGVCDSVHRGGVVCLSACWYNTPPQEQTPPSARRACWKIRSTRGRYASYWNAILFSYVSKYFVTNHHCKTQSECSDLENNINSLNYLQCAEAEQGCRKTSIINYAFNNQLLNVQLRSTLYSQDVRKGEPH